MTDDNIWSQDPVGAAVAARIRFRRIEIGMSQAELAEAVGVTQQQVHKCEIGTIRVNVSRLQAVADALGVPPSYFFSKPEPQAGVAAEKMPGDAIQAQQAFNRIRGPALRRRALSLLEALAGMQDGPTTDGD